jgi:hypothetical protein
MSKIDCKVIVCGPAIGKTYLAEHDKRFIDLDQLKSNYKYGLDFSTLEDKEKDKGNRGDIVKHDSTKYAINTLINELKNNKIITLSYSKGILEYLIDNKIKYCLVYPGKDLYKEYSMRMKKRGNSKKFIEEMTNKKEWEQFYISNVSDLSAAYKIELKKGQYLSDIRDMFLK